MICLCLLLVLHMVYGTVQEIQLILFCQAAFRHHLQKRLVRRDCGTFRKIDFQCVTQILVHCLHLPQRLREQTARSGLCHAPVSVKDFPLHTLCRFLHFGCICLSVFLLYYRCFLLHVFRCLLRFRYFFRNFLLLWFLSFLYFLRLSVNTDCLKVRLLPHTLLILMVNLHEPRNCGKRFWCFFETLKYPFCQIIVFLYHVKDQVSTVTVIHTLFPFCAVRPWIGDFNAVFIPADFAFSIGIVCIFRHEKAFPLFPIYICKESGFALHVHVCGKNVIDQCLYGDILDFFVEVCL